VAHARDVRVLDHLKFSIALAQQVFNAHSFLARNDSVAPKLDPDVGFNAGLAVSGSQTLPVQSQHLFLKATPHYRDR